MSKSKAKTAVLAILTALSLGACGGSEQEQTLYTENLIAPEEIHYETVQVEAGEYVKTASGSVSVYYPVTEELIWEGSNASLREILVKSGQKVEKGEILATFDIEISKADREELSLALTRLLEDTEEGKEERLAAIEKAEKEAEGLAGHELRIAGLKVEKLQIEYEQFVYQSEQKIAQYEERIEEMEEKIQKNTLTAPFDGVIDKVASCSPGDQITANQTLITMHATDRFYLLADDSSGNMRYNMEVTIEAGRKNNIKTYDGKVVAASNILPASLSQSYALIELRDEIAAEELEGTLRCQYNAEELQNVLLVDRSAISKEDGKNYVYVLEDNMVRKRYIVQGLANMDAVWVLDGLSAGQSVVLD